MIYEVKTKKVVVVLTSHRRRCGYPL